MTPENPCSDPGAEQPSDETSKRIEGEISRIEARIGRMAEEEISQAGYLLLSKLGASLGDDIKRIKSHTGMKLSDFITERLRDHYEVKEVLQYGRGILAVFRPGVAPETVGAIRSVDRANDGGFRYHHRFWGAFAVPAQGAQRFLDEREFTFRDAPADEVPPNGTMVITPDFITLSEIENRDHVIGQNIERWLAASGWSRERVSAKRVHNIVNSSIRPSSNRSLLDAVVEALDRRQLQSLTMPLDVVATLLRSSV